MDATADSPDTRSPGQVLADERERQGLSRADVAQRLHMSAYQIEAVEMGEYERLPKGPFLRGFVRNYAKALGLDAELVLSRLAETAPQAPAPGIVVPTQNIRFDPLGDRLASPYMKAGALAVVALMLGFAGMYWWLFIRPQPPAAVARKAPAEAAGPRNIAQPPLTPPEAEEPRPAPSEPINAPATPAPAPQASPAPPAPSSAPPPASATAPAKPAAAPPKPAPAPAKPASETVGSGSGTLKFTFRGESWVEVRDARGEVIVSRLNAGGTDLTARGTPPFTIIVGNAPDVALSYNGRDFPLAPHTKVAVARFKVE